MGKRRESTLSAALRSQFHLLKERKEGYMDSPPAPRWSTERNALSGEGLLRPRVSLLPREPQRLEE